MAHTRQSRPASGLSLQVDVLKTFQVVVSSLRSGEVGGCSPLEVSPDGTEHATSPQIVFFNCLDLHHKSPDSGERQYTSRTPKRRFDPILRSVGGCTAPTWACAFISQNVIFSTGEKEFRHVWRETGLLNHLDHSAYPDPLVVSQS